jgi:cardiolipin synthase A/B
MINRKASAVYTTHNRVKLVRGGSEYFKILHELIDRARLTIHLQTYIFENDTTGLLVAEALMSAARRGVAVYVLADQYASQHLAGKMVNAFKEAGVHFRWFGSLLYTRHFYFGRRLHHKVVVVDATYSLVGGVNMADRYNDLPDTPAWLDWALYSEGEASAELFMTCIDMWTRSMWRRKGTEILVPNLPLQRPTDICYVRVRRNDWVRRLSQVTRSYLEMLSKAESHVIIMSSYFLPGRLIGRKLVMAVRRGVKVQVIAAGKSDVWVAKQAERYIYRWLLRNKIELYEYQPRVLHGKLSVYDGKWVTVGSYNVNNISAYASIELNMDVMNAPFARAVEHVLNTIRDKECVSISAEEYTAGNNIFKRILQWASYEFIRLVFYLFTFYFKQRD